jgi:hypothetical protein
MPSLASVYNILLAVQSVGTLLCKLIYEALRATGRKERNAGQSSNGKFMKNDYSKKIL